MSLHTLPRGLVAARLAIATHCSEVPPTPTPTIVGGQVFPPAETTLSMTKDLTPLIPSAGIAIFKNELFSEPLPFGTISISSNWSSSQKSIVIAGISMPQEV